MIVIHHLKIPRQNKYSTTKDTTSPTIPITTHLGHRADTYFSSKYLATSIKDVANLVCSQSDDESGELIFKNYFGYYISLSIFYEYTAAVTTSIIQMTEWFVFC